MHFGIARVHHFFCIMGNYMVAKSQKKEVIPMFELAYPKKETACQHMKR